MSRWAPLLLALATVACSLLIDFDHVVQPCDQGQCNPGFVCLDGGCHPAEGAPPPPCQCGPGQQCIESTGACVADPCLTPRCGVGQWCRADGAAPRCLGADAGLGQACASDADCAGLSAAARCLLGLARSTGQRSGLCVEACPSPASSCPSGTVCLADAGAPLCAPERAVFACRDDEDCKPNLVCTLFDHPALGPVKLCDLPHFGGAPGTACGPSAATASCANGLCAPQVGKAEKRCAQLCEPNQAPCPVGQNCTFAEVNVVGVPRFVTACTPPVSRCLDCANNDLVDLNPVCQADAPRCTAFDGGFRCLAACEPDAGLAAPCPAGLSCVLLGAEHRCVPSSCP